MNSNRFIENNQVHRTLVRYCSVQSTGDMLQHVLRHIIVELMKSIKIWCLQSDSEWRSKQRSSNV